MNREDRQIVQMLADNLRERFGKESLNAGEFAKYLGRTRQYVCEKIKRRELPGFCTGNQSFSVPVNSIAIWEVRLSRTKTAEVAV